jgi:hypothetical protein
VIERMALRTRFPDAMSSSKTDGSTRGPQRRFASRGGSSGLAAVPLQHAAVPRLGVALVAGRRYRWFGCRDIVHGANAGIAARFIEWRDTAQPRWLR